MNGTLLRRPTAQSKGISLVELLGCITAVGVGIAAGAYYLGVDLHVAAYRALEQNKIIENLPAEVQQVIPVPASEAEPVLTGKETQVRLQSELDELRLEISRLAKFAEANPDAETATLDDETPQVAETREKTVVYWSRLQDIAHEVEQLLGSSQQLLNQDNVWKVLEVHRRAYQYGAEALAAAECDGVDPQAKAFGTQLINWYRKGSELYAEAIGVWEKQQLGAATERADLVLEHGRQQLANEAQLLADRATRLCELLGKRLGVPFEPAAPWNATPGQ
jgi:hypothetical protein